MPESLDYDIIPDVVTPDEPDAPFVAEGSEAWAILGIGALGSMVLGLGPAFGAVDEDGDAIPIPLGWFDPLDTAQRRVWKQFEPTTSWRVLMIALGLPFTDVEATAEAIEPHHYVSRARGVFLEEIGALVGLPRGGQTDDDDYRLAIIAEALSLVTTGAPDDMLDLAVRLAPEGSVVTYTEDYPASFSVTVTDLEADRFELIRTIMADMPPAGVGAALETFDVDLTAGWDYADDVTPFGTWAYDATEESTPYALWSYSAQIG